MRVSISLPLFRTLVPSSSSNLQSEDISDPDRLPWELWLWASASMSSFDGRVDGPATAERVFVRRRVGDARLEEGCLACAINPARRAISGLTFLANGLFKAVKLVGKPSPRDDAELGPRKCRIGEPLLCFRILVSRRFRIRLGDSVIRTGDPSSP